MRVLWNGEVLNEFGPGRGIRQEDHISLYLFVLCMERLFHVIQIAADNKYRKPI